MFQVLTQYLELGYLKILGGYKHCPFANQIIDLSTYHDVVFEADNDCFHVFAIFRTSGTSKFISSMLAVTTDITF